MSESEKVSMIQVEPLPEESLPEEARLEEPSLEELSPEELSPEEPREASAEPEEFNNLLNSYAQYSQPATGTMLHGHVVKIGATEVIVDVGYKCEGVIPLDEFRDDWGNLRVQPGDAVEVIMESREERDGYVTLSHRKARQTKAWEDIETAYQRQTPITARIMEKIKGGLAVDIGVRAFLPGSQIDIKPVRDLDALLGQELPCRVVKLNRKRSNIVVSRKMVIEDEQRRLKEHTLDQLAEGAVLSGVVKNLTDYGAFVDIGGIDGLLHVTDMSWSRVNHPSEVLAVGQELQVRVLRFDREKGRVSLGLKQLQPDPWATVAEQFAAGTRIRGRVVNVTDYGAFVELAPGLEGLVHVSEMTWSKRLKHPSKIVSPGEVVEVVVLEVNPRDRRISLGLRQTEANPWATLVERYPVGSIIEGRVRNLTDFGAFVEVEEGIDGLVHVSDLSWTRRIKRPSEVLKKGDTVRAVVLNIDPEHRRLSLGIKQLESDVWETFSASHHVGDTISGQVVRTATFGVFVRVADGIEGLCHISEISSEPVEKRSMPLAVGQECAFRIIKLNPAEKKVGLSVKALQEVAVRREPERLPPTHSTSGATTTIQEVMAMKERNSPKN